MTRAEVSLEKAEARVQGREDPGPHREDQPVLEPRQRSHERSVAQQRDQQRGSDHAAKAEAQPG